MHFDRVKRRMLVENPYSLYQGRADGGPVNGKAYTSRFPRNVPLVGKPRGRCWLYAYEESADGPRLVWRNAAGELVVAEENAPRNRFRASDGTGDQRYPGAGGNGGG